MKPSRAAALVLALALVLAVVAEASTCDDAPMGDICKEAVFNKDQVLIQPCCTGLSAGYTACVCQIRDRIGATSPDHVFCPDISCPAS
uniref:Bifunctional inhibitor/plant lipid transfer protein/seed storage helical domain-containing protein n=1 Tax=Aegilops tauschii subsp. strangulata TaxID=200361 RepID=A0A453QE26_AEGTS